MMGCWALLLVCAGRTAYAQTDPTCVPPASGVPYLNGQPPRWRDDGSGEPIITRFEDPRWRGAVSHEDASGHVGFRALYDETGQEIYLSWQVRLDIGGLNVNEDELLFGIKAGVGADSTALAIKFTITDPSSGANDAQDTGYDIAVSRALKSGGVWSSYSAVPDSDEPAWIAENTRVWTEWSGSGAAFWAFQTVVRKSSNPDVGLNIGDGFALWYSYLVSSSVVDQYHWPSERPDLATPEYQPIPQGDEADHWGELALVTAPAGTTCAGDVALARNKVGTLNPIDSEIRFEHPSVNPAGNNIENVFFARPKNIRPGDGAPLFAGAIEARFFIANWGSVATTDWNDPNVWKEITEAGPPVSMADIIPDDEGEIQSTWTVPADERCLYLPETDPDRCEPGRRPHQCMLVVLSGKCVCADGTTNCAECDPANDPPPLIFRNQSIYRNMDFESASVLRRDADVSVVGLTPLADDRPDRDVYLYVETRNMPAEVESDWTIRDSSVVIGGYTIPLSEGDSVVRLNRDTLVGPDTVIIAGGDTVFMPGRRQGNRSRAIRRALERGPLNSEQVDAVMPTFRVHAYHATGDTLTRNGVSRPIVHAQTSFGYWVDHTGRLKGWRYRVDGARLERIAPDFYKLAVPNNGVAVITTEIRAVQVSFLEKILIALVLLLLLTLLIWNIFR